MRTFETLYRKTEINKRDWTKTYNDFIGWIEVEREEVEGDDFSAEKFKFFADSWRWNAQQNQMDFYRMQSPKTLKGFLKEVYQAAFGLEFVK